LLKSLFLRLNVKVYRWTKESNILQNTHCISAGTDPFLLVVEVYDLSSKLPRKHINWTISLRERHLPMPLRKPVTSLGHQEGRRVFWEGPTFFVLCPIVSNYVQDIFLVGTKNFLPAPSWLRACLYAGTKCARKLGGGQTLYNIHITQI